MIRQPGLADTYTDFHGVAQLKQQARTDPKAAARETSRQFESMFVQMALKSMRQATPRADLVDSRHSDSYRDMYDQQLAVELGKRGQLGLADMIAGQLEGGRQPARGLTGKTLDDYRGHPLYRPLKPKEPLSNPRGTAATDAAEAVVAAPRRFESRRHFVDTLWPHVQDAAAELGVDPKLLLAQAALETGWGKSLAQKNGEPNLNLFGIKADRQWSGARTSAGTLEFVDGLPVRQRAAFRAYSSFGESFRDYVDFIKSNPRYARALDHAQNPHRFIAELQKAGYATDPQYARKVLSIYRNTDELGDLRAG